MKSSVLFDQTYKQFFAIAVENWSLGYRMDSRGGLRGRCRYPQVPGSPHQWPTDEPYSVIVSNELGLCVTILGKELSINLQQC